MVRRHFAARGVGPGPLGISKTSGWCGGGNELEGRIRVESEFEFELGLGLEMEWMGMEVEMG